MSLLNLEGAKVYTDMGLLGATNDNDSHRTHSALEHGLSLVVQSVTH